MWRVRVATEHYTLYPNQFPEDVPIAQIAEYNVTIDSNSAACTDNVTLSLLLTENVIQHVPYVECIIRTGSGATAEMRTSDRVPVNVPSTTQTPQTTVTQTTVTPTVITNTTTVRQGNPFTLTPEVAVDIFSSIGTSGSCRPYCHDCMLFLCIYFYIFTNLL